MQIAIIDLGTNTFNLLIAEVNGTSYTLLHSSKMPVRLGEGGITRKTITLAAMQRGIEALRTHKETIETFSVSRIFAFATSAMRDADNGKEYAQHIKNETGIDVRIIDGNTEASLIYKGVRMALDLGNYPVLIMDIGGGSTEFIIADKEQVFWQQSFQLGVSRLMEMFHPSDPIQETEIQSLNEFLHTALQALFEACQTYPCHSLIGSSGSFDTLAEIATLKRNGRPMPVHCKQYVFHPHDMEYLSGLLLPSTLQERLQIPGMLPMRADMMVTGMILIEHVLRHCNIAQVRQSGFSLKEGVLAALVSGEL